MSGLAQFLLGELATISAETRRRWPEVREVRGQRWLGVRVSCDMYGI